MESLIEAIHDSFGTFYLELITLTLSIGLLLAKGNAAHTKMFLRLFHVEGIRLPAQPGTRWNVITRCMTDRRFGKSCI